MASATPYAADVAAREHLSAATSVRRLLTPGALTRLTSSLTASVTNYLDLGDATSKPARNYPRAAGAVGGQNETFAL
jgi:hypothetical protein